MQNMLHYLMRLRLHVSVLVPKAKASERQAKPRNLLYLVSEVHVAARSNQLLHRIRLPVTRRYVDRRTSILGKRARGVVWCGGGGERVWWIYILDIHTHIS